MGLSFCYPFERQIMKRRTRKQISYNMSCVRSRNTTIEKKLGKALWARDIRYRKNYQKLSGKPDFVIVRTKIAIFCDSAFWHGYKNMTTRKHNFKRNKSFWVSKIKRNIERDQEVNKVLKEEGWKVLRFWDFEIENSTSLCVKKVSRFIGIANK